MLDTAVCLTWFCLLIQPDSSTNLLVVDVYGDPLAKHQLQGGRVAELHRGFHDQINTLVGRCDAIEVHGVVNGRVPGANR